MLTFNSDKAKKQKLIGIAAALSPRVGDNDRHRTREKLWWSSRTWCPAPYVCKKGADCDHRFYADQVGVPVDVAYAEHALFLELPTREAKAWSARFLSAIPVGVDLDAQGVFRDLALFLLADPVNGAITFAEEDKQHEAISRVITLFEDGCEDLETWKEAGTAAARAGHSNSFDDSSSEPKSALKQAARHACSTAEYLCRAFENPRYAAEAVSWSAWAHRYRTKARYTQKRMDDTGDDRPYIYAGSGESYGERERHNQYVRIADAFVAILKNSAGGSIWTRFLSRVRALFASLV